MSGQLNLAITGSMLLTVITIHLFQSRFEDTEPYGASNLLPGMSFLIKLLNNTPAEDSNSGNIAECAAGTSGQTSEWYITEVRSQLFTNSDVGTCQYCTVRLQHPAGNGDRCHYTSHQFGERLLVHVEEHRAWTEGLRTILRISTVGVKRVTRKCYCKFSASGIRDTPFQSHIKCDVYIRKKLYAE